MTEITWSFNMLPTTICKSRHWNLGTGIGIGNGIGIGTDNKSAVIFSSIRPMDPKAGWSLRMRGPHP